MNDAEKITIIGAITGITDQDIQINAYLSLAKAEILAWMYSGETPETVTDVPAKYETIQMMAVVTGINSEGAEGQLSHSENAISRTWKYEDMVAYVRTHVMPYVVVV